MSLTDRDIEALLEGVRGVTLDSRSAGENFLFAALPGTKADGRDYIGDAVRNGAVAVLAPSGTVLPDDAGEAKLATSDNPRRDLSRIAAAFYRRQPDVIAAVTGTSGKTSTVHFMRQIWEATGAVAGSLGTLGVQSRDVNRYGSLTTPDPVALHATLADLAAAGVTRLAMEASSHGLDQYRLDGVAIRAAGFTNLSRDHLDYHDDMEDYFRSKLRLFTELLPEDGVAVINADDEYGARLIGILKERGVRVFDYGRNAEALRIERVETVPEGCRVMLNDRGDRFDFIVPLAGEFQAFNAVLAFGLALSEAPDDTARRDRLIAALKKLEGAPGRLQFVGGHPEGAAIYVDYAHKPDALEKVLRTLRPHVRGRLLCLVGCGGDRDSGKRPIMGRIGAELSDRLVITDDNPRSENPAAIRKAVLEGAPGAIEIEGRARAIRETVAELKKGDVLVIAGKGHEQGQIIGDVVEPFDDVRETEKAITLLEKK